MSVVIIGGNECMERRYKDLCKKYDYKAKIYSKMSPNIKNLGNPDLLVLFTSTMSHKMLRTALNEVKSGKTCVARCHTSSMTALKNILDMHVKGGAFNV